MITCPWCGTNYQQFQSNCSNCGGPIQTVRETDRHRAADDLPVPPPAPRSIAPNYAWRLVFSDGWAVAAFVFLLLGSIFLLLSAGLTITIITAFVGIPFAGLGVLFLGAGIPLFIWRYRQARKTVTVLQTGDSTRGKITDVSMNPSVQVNGRNPWMIAYRFQFAGQEFSGQVTTLTPPGPQFQAGRATCILYLPESPQNNAIYPHP
jgi:hypothetical protein